MTQCERILDYIKSTGSITQREAISLGIYRLASRINDLKAAGIRIDTERILVKNCDGTSSSIARYSLRKKEANGL